MNLNKAFFHIWVLKLFLSASLQDDTDGFFNTEKSKDKMLEAMIHIIQSCYDKNETIVLSGNWINNEAYSLNQIFLSEFPVTLIGLFEDVHFTKHKRLQNVFKMDGTVIGKKKYPGNYFVIMVPSDYVLLTALKMLKKSVLWNHEGFFLIVWNNREDRCKTARSLLHTAWSFRILSATLLCNDVNDTLQLYTFNPFTDFAPKIWKFIEIEKEEFGYWILYQLSLDSLLKHSHPTFCKNLSFDKTRHLGGYTIRMGASLHPRLLPYDELKTGLRRFGGVNGNIALAIWSHLNASAKVLFYKTPGYIDDNGTLQSVLKDLLTRKIEVSMNLNLLRDFWRLQSYPQETGGFCIVSRKDHADAYDNFEGIFSPKGWLYLGVLVVLLTLTFMGLLSRSLSYAALELLRMLVNMAAVSHPPGFFGKMLFASFALLMMLLNMYFQSRLTSMDVVPITGSTIDNDADLVKSNLEIRGTMSYYEMLPDLDVKDRYRSDNFDACMDLLMNGSRVVCIAGCYEAKFKTTESDEIHVAKEFRMFHMAFSMAEDWPFYTRFNDMLTTLNEAGLIGLFRRREAAGYVQNVDNKSNNMKGIVDKNMKLNWYLWFCGIILATFTFLVEICIFKIRIVKLTR